MQVYELRRFGADMLLGEASMPLSSVPHGGRPRYCWLPLTPPEDADTGGAATTATIASVHVRVQWAERARQRGYMAVDVALQGVGVSIMDSLSAQVLRELTYAHISDLQARPTPHFDLLCRSVPA